MAAEKRKPVIFNVENPRDKALFDFAEALIPNWSGFVKDNLERIAKKRGITVPPSKLFIVPETDQVTTPKQAEK